MKLLFITQNAEALKENPEIPNKINTLPGIYSFFFTKYLKEHGKKIGQEIEILYEPHELLNYKKYKDAEFDHCFITLNRGPRFIKDYADLKRVVSKKIITICETNGRLGPEDVLLYFYHDKKKANTLKINWMADETLLYPEKFNDKFVIFVDHRYYCVRNERMVELDLTEQIIESLLAFKKKKDNKYNNKTIEIRHLVSNKVICVENIKDIYGTHFRQGHALSYCEIAQHYRQTDVFIVTHLESMGITCLECNMTGALCVMPKDYIKNGFAKQLYLEEITNIKEEIKNIDWDSVFSKVDYEKARNKIKDCTYSKWVPYVYEKVFAC